MMEHAVQKYIVLILILLLFSSSSCIKPQERENSLSHEILFIRHDIKQDGSDNQSIYILNVEDGKINKLFDIKVDKPPYISDVETDQETVRLIKTKRERVKFLFEKPLRVFKGKFCAYSNYIEPGDIVAGGEVYKGIYLYNLENRKKIKIDEDIFVNSLSFSHDLKYLFINSLGNLYAYSMDDGNIRKVIEKNENFFGMMKMDRVSDEIYLIADYVYPNLYRYRIKEKKKELIIEGVSQYIIDPKDKNLIYIRNSYQDGRSYLGILNIDENKITKEIEFYDYRINGFLDEKNLVVSSYPSKKSFNISIYILNLDAFKLEKIYSP